MAEETKEQEQEASMVSNRSASRLAWSLAALSVAMFLASVALWILAHSAPLPSGLRTSVTLIDMSTSVPS